LTKEEMDTVVDWLNKVLDSTPSSKDEEIDQDAEMSLE
jgi:hypothetical protein